MAKNSSARRLAIERSFGPPALRVAEAVADAAHGEEVLGVLRVALELLAQVADVHVDRARVAVGAVAPDAREQHVARQHAARAGGQREQDLELDEGGLHRSPRTSTARLAGSMRSSWTSSGPLVGRLAPGHARAAQRRLHAAAELAQRERLGDVVVGAELEPEHLVDLLGLGGEHDDRHRRARAHAPAHLEPVEAGHHHVEHDEVERRLAEARERLAAVGGLHDLVAVLAQRVGEQRLDRLLVVDEQDAGRVLEHVGSGQGRPATLRFRMLDPRIYRAALSRSCSR